MTAAVEALEAAIVRWSRAEAGTQQVTLAQYLAALDGWTLVRAEEAQYTPGGLRYPTLGELNGGPHRDDLPMVAPEAEITRLRAALEGTCRRYDPDDGLPCWCYASVPLELSRVHEDRCLETRAALAPEAER